MPFGKPNPFKPKFGGSFAPKSKDQNKLQKTDIEEVEKKVKPRARPKK